MATASGASGLARIWLNLSLSRKGAAIVAIPVLCIFAMLAMFGRLQRRAEVADQWVVHTAQVLTESKEILSYSLSIESTARGYLLTREPAFLEIQLRSRRLLLDAFGRIDVLTADNATQRDRMRRCLGLAREEMAALDAQLASGTSGDLTPAVNASRHRIDHLRSEIDAFDREERRLLELRQITRLSHRIVVRLSLIAFAILGILSGLLGARLFTNGVMRRLDRIAENAARISRREAKDAVDGSSDAIGRLEVALIGATRDVLDREERLSIAAAELARAKETAESAARAKTDFIASLSHEIRSPMNALLGGAEMLQGTRLDPQQAEYVALLNRAGSTLLSTVNEVLDHAKIESGQLELESVPFDCAGAIERVASLMNVAASAKGLDLLVKYTPATPRYVSGDPGRLQRVLVNLVSNAIKFTDSGVVAIRVEPAAEPNLIHFSVADSGIGIPPDRQQAIFDQYVQAGASTSRTHGGTGLGLSICRHIVEKMGGRIWVESAAGEGSTFHFTALLPATPAPDASAKSRATEGAPAVARPLGARILLAEDSVSNVALVKAYLTGADCRLDVAPDGIAALEFLRSERYNLALMDVQMPGMDGYEVTRRFRQWERENRRPRTPIVSVTAHAFYEDIEKAIQSGADAHLTKPFRRDELLDTIELYQRRDNLPEIRVSVPEFVSGLAPEFLRRQRYALLAVTAALKNGDLDPVQTFAHNIKGSGKSFGFPRLTDLGRDMEDAAKARRDTLLRSQIAELRDYLTAVEIEL